MNSLSMVDYDQSLGKWKDRKHIGSWYDACLSQY